jgi:phosphoribosylanthranilate isomerase
MVKVCGITRRQDAEAAVAAGASAIGFIFYPKSPRYVTAEAAKELGAGLDIWKVGVFQDESPSVIENTMRAAQLDVAQVYGGDLPKVPRVWRAVRVRETRVVFRAGQASDAVPIEVEAILLDGPATGIVCDWNLARALSETDKKTILAGGLNASNVAEAIRIAKPWGVDASSGLESAPGVKDPERIRQFVKAAQEAGRAGFSSAESKS